MPDETGLSFLHFVLPLVLLVLMFLYLSRKIKQSFAHVIIHEYEAGVKYRKGRFIEVLSPGRHLIYTPVTTVHTFDLRKTNMNIQGQEVLTSDNVTVKLTASALYQISDPHLALTATDGYWQHLYLTIQLAIREAVATYTIEDLLEKRKDLAQEVDRLAKEKLGEIGVNLLAVELRDIMLPGDLKKAYAALLQAKKESQAKLEAARGEIATLRSLANAANMMKNNPALMQLRLLQAMEQTSGNTYIIGAGMESIGNTVAATVSKPAEESD